MYATTDNSLKRTLAHAKKFGFDVLLGFWFRQTSSEQLAQRFTADLLAYVRWYEAPVDQAEVRLKSGFLAHWRDQDFDRTTNVDPLLLLER